MVRVAVTVRGEAGGPRETEVADGTAVGDLPALLGRPRRLHVFVVNGSAVAPATPLRDGDRVQIYPAAAGG